MLGMSMIVDKVSVDKVKDKLENLKNGRSFIEGPKRETLQEIQDRLDREEVEASKMVKKRKKVKLVESDQEENEKVTLEIKLAEAKAK